MAKKGLEYLLSEEKRRVDIVGGTLCAIPLLPLAATTAVASMIDTRTMNPLFIQSRVGGRGEEESVQVMKFRTIPQSLGDLVARQTFGTFDPRASRTGVWIRQMGLDEVPQLLNVLDGSMSLVGTRPLARADIERNADAAPHIFDEWYEYFKVVKPGLIGPSQVLRHHYRQRTPEVVAASMEIDLRYFEAATFMGDIRYTLRAPLDVVNANIGVIENIEH